MPIPYTEFRWSYPPRGDTVIPYKDSSVLRMWKKFDDSVAQYKMNGTNDQVVVFPDRRIEHWSRHKVGPNGKPNPSGTPKRLDYTLPTALRDEILDFTPKGKFTVYNAELLHAKTTMVKDTLYFFDVLVWDGEHLLGVEYGKRHALLMKLLGPRYFPLDLNQENGKLFVAENLTPNQWDEAWQRLQRSPYTEGLVLKRTGAVSRLQLGDREKNNGGYICKCRKANKNSLY